MHKLTQPELDGLARIGKSPDGAFLRQILSQKLESFDKRIRALDGTELYRAQGHAQELVSLLGYLDAPLQSRPTTFPRAKAQDQAFMRELS